MRNRAAYYQSLIDNRPVVYRYMSEVLLMNTFKHLKNVLNYHIGSMSKSASLFTVNPETDFTRERKLPFGKVMKCVLCMEAGALKDELLKYSDYASDTPTASAFIQARGKIKVDAFTHLFNHFNNKTHKDKQYKGYRLLAIDGCEVPIDNTFKDKETTLAKKNKIVYSAYHLNASYDLLECTYDDLIIQGEAKMDEKAAFRDLVDRYGGKKAIFIADRGYEGYNDFEHVVHSGNKYLIRVKDIHTERSMTQSLGPYPDTEEFDIDVVRALTLKQNKMTKSCSYFRFLPVNVKFDYMDKDNPFYEFSCRVVRFKIADNTYECIITNLDRDEFSLEEIKELYNKRWGIETSFRLIKYALDLNAFHSRRRNLIQQEIYARMTIYNLSQRVIQDIKIPAKKRKYTYQVNFTRAFHIIRKALKTKTGAGTPVEDLIVKEILPVRPGRKDTRHVKQKKVVCFNYRYD